MRYSEIARQHAARFPRSRRLCELCGKKLRNILTDRYANVHRKCAEAAMRAAEAARKNGGQP